MEKEKHYHNKSMFSGASSILFERAKHLRANLTNAEMLLWEELKSKKHFDYKFRRQHPYANFIFDFYCHKLKLVIEVDGKYHLTPKQKLIDAERDKFVEEDGLHVLRFTNDEICNELKQCIKKIKDFITEIG